MLKLASHNRLHMYGFSDIVNLLGSAPDMAHCKKMFCKKTVMCWQQSRQQFTVILQYSYCEIILQFITVKMKYSIILFIF